MRGLGLWLWRSKVVADGDPAKIVSLCVRYGVRRLYVKVADGASAADPMRLDKLGDALAAACVEIFAWAYDYDSRTDAAADALLAGAKAIGAKGVIVNAEKEFTDDGGKGGTDEKAMRALLGRVRAAWPGALGLSSFKFPRSHPAFPWHVLREFGAFGMPQVYLWGPDANARGQLRRAVDQYAALGTVVLPTIGSTQSCHSPETIATLASEVAALAKTGACLPAMDVWSLDQLEPMSEAWAYACRRSNDALLAVEQPAVDTYRCPLDDGWDAQAALLRLGRFAGPVRKTWDAQAKAAAKAFQAAHGLVADGVVGPKTQATLRAALSTAGLP